MKTMPLARRAREIARGREVVKSEPGRLARWGALAVVFLLTVLITSPAVWSFWRKGQPAAAGAAIRSPIVASIGFEYADPDLEEKWEEERLANSPRIFNFDSGVRARGLDLLDRALAAAQEAAAAGATPEQARDALAQVDPQFARWTPEQAAALASLAPVAFYRQGIRQVVRQIYGNGLITPPVDKDRFLRFRATVRIRSLASPPGLVVANTSAEDLISYPNEANDRADGLLRELLRSMEGISNAQFTASSQLVRACISPNLTFNFDATEEAFEAYPRPEPTVSIAAGTVLAGPRGTGGAHLLTADEAHLVAAYRAAVRADQGRKFIAQVLFVLIAFLIISFFVRKFGRELAFSTNTVMLVAAPVVLALALGRLLLLLAGEGNEYIGYAFPAGLIGILGVLLLDVRLAILMVTCGCLLFGLAASLNYEFVIVGLFGGYAAVAALFDFRERREVLYAGILIGVVNASTILVIHYISGWTDEAMPAAAVGALAGVLCSLLVFAVLPVFEVLFKVTTDMRLLELSGLEHPLLRRMEEVAPGTWQHTLNVTKLAESAASEIGVNYLLVRAACLFHDIGKMSKPKYFTENQVTAEEKGLHAKLTPQMSTLVIRNHVKEGVEMAREAGLPGIIIDFIPQHHGTSLIQYFYVKALTAHQKGESKEPVRESEYRYPGPKPQSIEAAIIMLADTVEATAMAKLSGRSVRDDEIQVLVRNAIFEKFNDGQFDDCGLTLRDLNTIRESLVKTLRARFHSRVDYPAKAARAPEPARSRREKAEQRPEDAAPAPTGQVTAAVVETPAAAAARSATESVEEALRQTRMILRDPGPRENPPGKDSGT